MTGILDIYQMAFELEDLRKQIRELKAREKFLAARLVEADNEALPLPRNCRIVRPTKLEWVCGLDTAREIDTDFVQEVLVSPAKLEEEQAQSLLDQGLLVKAPDTPRVTFTSKGK